MELSEKKSKILVNPKKSDLMKESIREMLRLEVQNLQEKAKKTLDPVGKEDKDIDNDGDHDKSDRYLLNRRKVRSKVIKMKEAAHDALRSKRAKSPKGEGAVDTAPDESNVGEETLHEISADTGLAASRAADQKRAQLAKAGDKEGAAGKAAQAKRLYDAQAKKRLKETEDRIKERMIQFTKDHDNQMAGKQPI